MSAKKVGFGKPRSQEQRQQDPEDWIKSRAEQPEKPPMKRLTLDIPAELHTRIKTSCAQRGTRMVEEIRELLESHYRD